MALTTYAELKTAVAAWMDVSTSALSTTIDDLITVAEARIFREVRTRDTEAVLSGTIAAGVIAVPSDYIALKFAYLNTSPSQILERRDAEWIYSQYPIRSSAGRPKYIARESGNFIIRWAACITKNWRRCRPVFTRCLPITLTCICLAAWLNPRFLLGAMPDYQYGSQNTRKFCPM